MPVAQRVVNWTGGAASAVARLRADARRRLSGTSALQKTDSATFPDIAARDAAASNGRAALAMHNRCLRAFDATGRARTEYQRSFQNALTRASIYSFFGAATDAEMGNVARENGWTLPIKQEIAIAMPRRYGKTEGCGQWLAAAMLSMRGRKFAIFAPGKRQACMLLDVVKANLDLLCETLGIHVQKIKDNETGLWIRHQDGSVNRLQAYPCKINIRTSGARGGRCEGARPRGPAGCTTADTYERWRRARARTRELMDENDLFRPQGLFDFNEYDVRSMRRLVSNMDAAPPVEDARPLLPARAACDEEAAPLAVSSRSLPHGVGHIIVVRR